MFTYRAKKCVVRLLNDLIDAEFKVNNLKKELQEHMRYDGKSWTEVFKEISGTTHSISIQQIKEFLGVKDDENEKEEAESIDGMQLLKKALDCN